MRFITLWILSFSFIQTSYCQTFLDGYRDYRLGKAEKITNSKSRKMIKKYIKSHLVELDTVFQSYKAKTNFDFNTADSLFIIYEAPAESPFTSVVIIWSGKDTISYRQAFESISPFKSRRVIFYEPYNQVMENPKGFKIITERDSLITLVSKRDFITINHLGDNQHIDDGSYVSIYVAYQHEGKYTFEFCSPKQFFIPDSYRKE